MIYFDNSATGGFKPRSVTDTVQNIIRYLSSNPGRSGHRLSVTGANIVYDTRRIISDFFKCRPEHVIFTKNCTEALNIAILGTVKKGGHVITTNLEHNSVLRPLTHLKEEGIITYTVVDVKDGDPVASIRNAITPSTYMIVTTSVSNVTGESLPVYDIAEVAKNNNLLYLVDGAQGGGHMRLTVEKGISMIALAGHKGLYGIMGSGVLVFDKNVDVKPLSFGGTGTESFNLSQPLCYPERLESGTLNLPAVASLFEGIRYVKNNFNNFAERLNTFTAYTIKELKKMKNITVYSPPNPAGIVSFKHDDIPSAELADILNKEYDIAVRGGLQCAPLIHKKLGTLEDGLLRASMSSQNSEREVDFFLSAISQLSKNR